MRTTLIVEDNASFRQTTRNLLLEKYAEMRILEAATGEQALQEVVSHSPELILMDIKLPGSNGLELTQEIKKLCPFASIVILTSYDFPEYREAAVKYGADHFLVKGTDSTEEILDAIKGIFSRTGET